MHRLLTILICILFASPAWAIVRRDDENDSQYIALGNSHSNAIWLNYDDTTINGHQFCSGTLIAPDWVMTACHCVDGYDNAADRANINIGNGAIGQLNRVNNGHLVSGVADIITHPSWVPNAHGIGNGNLEDGVDVALIKLNSPLSIAPMNRHSDTVPSLVSRTVTFVGYGRAGDGNDIVGASINDDLKRAATNKIDGRGNLFDPVYSNGPHNRDRLIAADFDGPGAFDRWDDYPIQTFEGSVAPGDSGGPWVVDGLVAGVSSFAGSNDFKYGDAVGATAVSPHNDWINETMGGVNWNSRGRGVNFDNDNAWGDGRVPFGDDVRFSLPTSSVGIPEIVVSTNRSVHNIRVEYGPHEFDIGTNDTLTATGSVLVNDGGTMIVGDGTLEVMNRLTVGHTFAPSTFRMLSGKVIASHPDGNSLYIALNGNGVFEQQGGELIVKTNASLAVIQGSTGTYNFSRGIATFEQSLFVGDGGTGIVKHFDDSNANLDVDDHLYLGATQGSSGSYVRTAGNLDVGGNLFVGYHGDGRFEQSSGTTTVDDEIAVGRFAGSDGRLKISGEILQCKNDFVAGYEGKGVVDITGGSVIVGDGLGDDLFVAIDNNNSNAVNQSGNSTVRVFGDVRIAESSSSFGTYRLAGGTLDVRDGQIFLGIGGSFQFEAGTLHVKTYNGDLTNGDGNLTNGIAIVAPRNSNGIDADTGITEVTGNYTQEADGILQIQIGGEEHGEEHDRLTADSLDLAGMLNVSLLPNFVPQLNNQFDILNWQTLNGTFDNVILPSLGDLLAWDTSALYTSGRLFVGLAGDFNANGSVDAGDYVLWREGGPLQNDTTPGVQPGDYITWRANFGRTATSGAGGIAASQAAVPEPESLILLVGGCLGFAVKRRKSSRRQ